MGKLLTHRRVTYKSDGACSNHRRYKGVREPRCFGGAGCWPCWSKFYIENSGRIRVEADRQLSG